MIKSFVPIGFLSVLLLFAFISCKKMKPGKTTPKEDTEEEKPPVIVPPKKKNMLPVKFTTAGLTVDIIYMDNMALITEMKFSGGVRYLMTYADKVLKKLQKYQDNVHVQSVDFLITDGQISRVTRFDVNGQRSTPTEKYYLTYNNKSLINNIKTYAVTNSLISDHTLEYQADGNLISSAATTGNSVSNYNYSYDAKNGIFESVLFCEFLRIELNQNFLNRGKNNLLNLSNPKLPKEDITCEYLYGTDDYPTELKIKQDGLIQNYKITYVELK